MSESNYQEVESFLDFTDRPVFVGDDIAYAVRSGSHLWMKKGKVQDIRVSTWQTRLGYERKTWSISVLVPGGHRRSVLETPDRIVKIPPFEEGASE